MLSSYYAVVGRDPLLHSWFYQIVTLEVLALCLSVELTIFAMENSFVSGTSKGASRVFASFTCSWCREDTLSRSILIRLRMKKDLNYRQLANFQSASYQPND